MLHDEGHAQMQTRFHAALWEPVTPEGLSAPDMAEVPRRMAVYRNNVQSGLIRALGARYPAVQRLVGPDFLAAAARVFAAGHPPRSPVLHDWGSEFPHWLQDFPPAAHLPWLSDVARIEDLRARAIHAADAPTADPAGLAVADPSALRLRLAASVMLFASAHPAVAIWAAQQPGAQPGPIAPGPSWALIARRPDYALLTLPLAAADHACVASLMAGATLGRAAQMGDPLPVLTTLITHGLIAAIEPESCT